MKYCVKDQLDLFEFHDSVFSFVSFDGKDLVVSAECLNIHEEAEENPHDCDMEIDLATISWQNVQILSLRPWLDENGNWYSNESQIVFTGKEAEEKLIYALKDGITLNDIDVQQFDDHAMIEIEATAPKYFLATFSYSDVTVEWDTYRKKAWYECFKEYRYEITLSTPDGEQKAPLCVRWDEENEYAPSVTVGIKFQDQEMWSHGKEYLWEDAFADLQKQLPADVILKCCLTCRYGSLCPFGNAPGEFYCTRGVEITSKNDLCDWFNENNDAEIKSRTRNCADTCEDYKQQSNDFFTYNDYLCYYESEE